jgi:hypothetical protein
MSKCSPTCKTTEICRNGYYRKAYTRSDGSKVRSTYVRPVCISSPKKSPRKGSRDKGFIGALSDGRLRQFGYSSAKSDISRHRALNAAVNEYGWLSVFRKLNAVMILNKGRRWLYDIFEKDRDWIRNKYLVAR